MADDRLPPLPSPERFKSEEYPKPPPRAVAPPAATIEQMPENRPRPDSPQGNPERAVRVSNDWGPTVATAMRNLAAPLGLVAGIVGWFLCFDREWIPRRYYSDGTPTGLGCYLFLALA